MNYKIKERQIFGKNPEDLYIPKRFEVPSITKPQILFGIPSKQSKCGKKSKKYFYSPTPFIRFTQFYIKDYFNF